MNDTSEIVTGVAGVILLVAAISGTGGLVGYGMAERSAQRAAIEANVAEWTIDAKTGVAEFRYRPCGEGTL